MTEMSYMDHLSPEEQEIVSTRFSQSPTEWPAGMAERVDEIIHQRDELMCGEVMVDVLAQYICDR